MAHEPQEGSAPIEQEPHSDFVGIYQSLEELAMSQLTQEEFRELAKLVSVTGTRDAGNFRIELPPEEVEELRDAAFKWYMNEKFAFADLPSTDGAWFAAFREN